MINRLAAALIVAPSVAFAGELELSSRIDRVTVYPDGAIVTRLGRAELAAGESRIVLRGLPAGVDPSSIRVEARGGGSFAIGAVDMRTVPGEARPVLDATLDEKLRSLREERESLAGQAAAIEGKRSIVERYGQAGPEKLGADGKALPLADWQAVWDAIGTALVKINDELRHTRRRAADVEAEIAALERAQPKPGQRGAPRQDVAIAVAAEAPLSADLVVSYRVAGASWRPVYEARLAAGAEDAPPGLELVRRAEIRQRTGEDWTDVNLQLSTVRASQGTRAPELSPLQVSFFEPPIVYESRQRATAAPGRPAAKAPEVEQDAVAAAPAPQAARLQTASLEAGAYQASFSVPGRATIPQDGSARTVILSQRRTQADLSATAAPELDETAYLEASFLHEEEAPLLPGEVSLHRDGTYIGRGRIGLTAPGEKVVLGFGADDRLKVSRVPVSRRENEPGWLGQSRTDLREFKTTVHNLHDRPVKITITERVPFSENSAITVELLSQSTPPTLRQVGDKRGVSAWTLELPAGAKKDVRLAYRIKWPGDRELAFNPDSRPRPLD